ncbi:MAG: hypothetical protein GX941_05070 [Candidatus Methanofastidiosa archaeon]|nr:hypothetical protein [Candidatus Methanofastidiosa archaeon]
MQKIFVDTNVLLNNRFSLKDYEKVYISIISIEELDNLKRDDKLGYQARETIRKIINADNVDIKLYDPIKTLFTEQVFTERKNDNLILNCAKNVYEKDNEVVFISDDYAMILKAQGLELPCEMFEFGEEKNNGYKGYLELNLLTEEVNDLFNELENNINRLNLLENQYLIIHEKGKRKIQEFRYSNGKLLQLKLPDSKFIKGMNSQQRCALDLLNNKNIPIRIIAGEYGSGKTFIATKMGLYHVFEKGTYGNILLLRNPLGSGEEIGFLPGEKETKIGDFFRCVNQYVDINLSKDKNINEYIKKDIPFYIKGMSYGSTYVYVEEAEDMDLKILKLIGSRIESDSCVVFCGDYKQSEPKYRHDNGLYQLINKLKGEPLVGIVVLDEDVRSEASKVFAKISG